MSSNAIVAQSFPTVMMSLNVTVAQLFLTVMVLSLPTNKQSVSRKATRARLNRLNNKQGGNNG